jgi:cephalosporin hydroxylase
MARARRVPYGTGTILDDNMNVLSGDDKQTVMDIRNQTRFVSYEERVEKFGINSQLDVKAYLLSEGATGTMRWKGYPMYKTTYDFALYPMIIQELKPKTIVEFGTAEGGSAFWMSDLCDTFGLKDTMVYSVDINKVILRNTDRVKFFRGDSNNVETLWDQLDILPHPWLIIEDSHVNINGIVSHFEKSMVQGDYIIVEDTRSKKGQAMVIPKSLKVDQLYCDFFGRNATCSVNSIFCKTS